MEAVTKPRWRVTDDQLREAERGLRRLLHAKRFRREWIEQHVPEIMSQARTDFAARLAAERVEDTVSLLVVIAYRRSLKLVTAERSQPKVTSIEDVFHLADEGTPTPEEEALDHDRHRRLVKAMGHLPEREQMLLALVYFEEMPLQEAGRKLGWAKASATRHHQAALEKLKALVGDRSLLGWEIGVPAYVAAGHHSVLRRGLMWTEGAAESVRDAALLGSGRIRPLAEGGHALATSGAGRTTAGVCAVAVGSCIAAATGVVGPGIAGLQAGGHGHDRPPARHAVKVAEPAGEAAKPAAPSPAKTTPEPSSSARKSSTSGKAGTNGGSRGTGEERAGSATTRGSAPKATTKQTINEFGVERGEGESSSSTESSGGAGQTAPARPSAPTGSGSSRGSSRSQGSSGSSAANSEFGL